jgi:hypothetical protein
VFGYRPALTRTRSVAGLINVASDVTLRRQVARRALFVAVVGGRCASNPVRGHDRPRDVSCHRRARHVEETKYYFD